MSEKFIAVSIIQNQKSPSWALLHGQVCANKWFHQEKIQNSHIKYVSKQKPRHKCATMCNPYLT